MKLFIISILLLSLSISYTQEIDKDLILIHNWNGMGKDAEIGIDKYFKRNVLHLGINFFTGNEIDKYEIGTLKYQANSIEEWVGLTIGYKKSLLLRNSSVELLPKFEVQFFRISTIERRPGIIYYHEPKISLNTSIGIDGKTQLSDRLYLIGGIEGGIIFDDNQYRGNSYIDSWEIIGWQLNALFSIGFLLRIDH